MAAAVLSVGLSSALSGGFGNVALAQNQDFSKVQIKVTPVAGSVYLLEGAGGNIAASVGDDGIVIVDDQFAPLADKIRAALNGVADKPLRFIINTHYHADHTGGNLPLHDATIVAHDNVRKRLAADTKGGNGGGLSFDQPASAKEALPIVTFSRDVTLHVNGEDIHALHAPSGHTDGDSIVYFTKSNVVHMGDDFVTYGFPFVDIAAGGSVRGMAKALEEALARLPADVKVIPGHGPISTPADVRAYVKMLRDTTAAVEKALKAGQSLERMKAEKVLASWEKYSGDFVNSDLFIETLYNDLTGKKSGAPAVRHN